MKKKLGEILIASGVVSQADIDEALRDQSAGEAARLGDQLIALGRLSSFQLAKALATQHGLPYMALPAITPRVMASVPLDFQQMHRLVPYRVDSETVSIAVADPSNTDAIEELRYSLQRKVVIAIAPGDEIDAVHSAFASSKPLPAAQPSTGYVTRPSPAPTAEELFGSLNLEGLEGRPGAVEVSPDLFGDPAPEAAAAPEPEERIEVIESFDDEVSFQSSSSSLEALVIAPNVPVLAGRPAAASAPPVTKAASAPAPAPSGPDLPDWLQNAEPPVPVPPTPAEWSGQLDDVPPSRLIVAAVKALVTSGVVSERAILDVLAKK
jgi:hypothetical protein